MRRLPLFLLLTGCPPADVDRGQVLVCLDGGRPAEMEDLDLTVEGTVTAVGAGTGGCAVDVTIEDAAGSATTIGLAVSDHANADVTPALDVAVGDAVSLLYRYRFVWGDTAGFVLSDADGLVVAAEEGYWGGALRDGDVSGLTVTRGEEVLSSEPTDCLPVEGFDLTFAGDDTATLIPVDSTTVSVGGVEVTALAVAAWDHGEPTGCDMSDATGVTAWVVSR